MPSSEPLIWTWQLNDSPPILCWDWKNHSEFSQLVLLMPWLPVISRCDTDKHGEVITSPCLSSKNYWQFSSTILIQFSCNFHAIIDEIFRNAPAILTYNSQTILTRQFSSNSHLQFSPTILIQFSPTILIQFSPDNSHPIFTWQFSSNFHLTILIQFSPTILTQFSSTLLSQFSPTMLSEFSRNDQPICSRQSCCYFCSMLIL